MQGGEIEPVGAVKIKDGLFMGDVYASQDVELLIMNKVTYVINCAGRELPNHWEAYGITYFTIPWQETDYQVLFEGKFDILGQVQKLIDMAISRGESVLVHSVRGLNRCCCLVAAYCMKKYRWTLNKTMEFVQSKRINMALRPNFFSQLMNLENKLSKSGVGARTYDWEGISDNRDNLESDELLITNTFLNSKPFPLADYKDVILEEDKPSKVVWVDLEIPGKSLGTVISFKNKTRKFTNPLQRTSLIFNEGIEKACVKSILKGSEKIFAIPERAKATSESVERRDVKKSEETGSKVTPGLRKNVRNLRPGSAMISNGKQKMLKSSSTPILQKPTVEVRPQNIKGSFVYVNFNAAEDDKAKAQKETKAARKVGLTLSSSNKELGSFFVKPFSLQSPFNEEMRDNRSILQRDDVFVLSQNFKVDNYSRNSNTGPISTLGIFGSGSSKHETRPQPEPKKMSQSLKGFKIGEPKPSTPSEKYISPYSPNFGITRPAQQGRITPTRSQNDNNFIVKNQKRPNRPETAPNSSSKKEAQEFRFNEQDIYRITKKQSQESRNGDQAVRMNPKAQNGKVITRAKLRTFSPGDFNNSNAKVFPPGFFEPFKVKLEF